MPLRILLILPFALLGSTSAIAQSEITKPQINTISTHATSHRRLPNTVADVSVSIQTEATTVAAVTKALAGRSQTLMSYLKSHGADRLETNQVNVDTKTHTVKGGPDQIVGYSGSINVTFRTTSEKVSDLITGALSQGANTVQSVTFAPTEEETDQARRELAADAAKIALAQAESVTKAVGEHVSGIREIVVDPGGTPIRPMMQSFEVSRLALAAPQQIATAAGEQDVSITVNLTAEISR